MTTSSTTSSLKNDLSKDEGLTSKVTPEQLTFFNENGFVKVENVLSAEQAEIQRKLSIELMEHNISEGNNSNYANNALSQMVNAWKKDEDIKALTLNTRIANLASQLIGKKLRVFHDHLLAKEAKNFAATEWHQDQPYWPHERSSKSLSVWIALQNTNVEMGCMSFLPGTKDLVLPPSNLTDPKGFFANAPESEYTQSVTIPLKAGDCTFHHSRTAHRAGPNTTEDWRMAHVVIYFDKDTPYLDKPHIMTSKLKEDGKIKDGDLFDFPDFPLVGDQ